MAVPATPMLLLFGNQRKGYNKALDKTVAGVKASLPRTD